MKSNKFLLGMVLGAGMVIAGVSAHAQDQQTTTTTSESMTTTNGAAPPPPPPMAAPQPGYATYGYAPDNRPARMGYNDGYDKGISDHDTGHSFRYKDDNAYRHPQGYMAGPMPKDEYERIYREAFIHGYERGYRRSADAPQAR